MKHYPIASRKDDHVTHALSQREALPPSDFELIRFVHHSFSLLSEDEIQLQTEWAGHVHAYPFYINAMTGGSSKTLEYNRQLARLAAATDLAIASGSVSAALKHPELMPTFKVIREEHPNGFILANLGAHHTLENAKKAVDLLEANALQIHLNVPQEVVMPEGDRDFRQWLTNIENIIQHIGVPVIVKEVGFGMSNKTIQQLINIGVETIDISGRGGTNFIKIEDERKARPQYQTFYHHGQSTAESLLEALNVPENITILASGGIRQPIDITKSLALGAKSVGVAGQFLATIERHGLDTAIEHVQQWQAQLQELWLMLGAKTISDLQQTDIILSGHLRDWAIDRQLPYQHLANRSTH